MAQAYSPGLKVTNRITHRARRVLPISGEVKPAVGERVTAEQIVAETFMPGDVTPINLANLLSTPPAEVPKCMLVEEGTDIEVGQVIARTNGIFGWFRTEYKSKTAGTIESISQVTGQLIVRGASIPVQVKAFLPGKVAEVIAGSGVVIEAEVTYIQGIFGIGGETYGPIVMACDSYDEMLTPEKLNPEMKGAVVIGGARVSGETVSRAVELGVSAIISGGIDDQDLKEILGYDLGVAITGTEQIGTTLIITEGFGDIAMAQRTFELLKSRVGDQASVNGATQIRAGVMRPEIVIPLSEAEQAAEEEPAHIEPILETGRTVRIIRDPHFGVLGTVKELPPEPQVLESGSRARVLVVETAAGETVTVPRANVEIITR